MVWQTWPAAASISMVADPVAPDGPGGMLASGESEATNDAGPSPGCSFSS
jgi:hypothetical protein